MLLMRFPNFLLHIYCSMANHLTLEQRNLYDKFMKYFENDPEYVQNPNRLQCLAQTYLNVRFLNCSYDQRLMSKIKSMSEVFMKSIVNDTDPSSRNRKKKHDPDNEADSKKARQDKLPEEAGSPTCSTDTGLKDFVLLRRPDVTSHCTILQMSAHFSKKILKFEETSEKPSYKCEIFVSDQAEGSPRISIAKGKAKCRKEARQIAAKKAYDDLSSRFYTVALKSNIDPETAQIDMQKKLEKQNTEKPKDLLTGIGAKLMAKWGWTDGKGMGKNEQGIEKPVEILQRFARHGLGSVLVDSNFNQLVKSIIAEYSSSDEQDDLVFAANLNIDQRKFIHNMARHHGLKTTSYGSGMDRQLTIKKPKSAMQLVEHLRKNGYDLGIYQLIEPGKQML